MVATVSHGIVYVVQRDRPSGSSFNKGDRVTMVRPVDKPSKSGEFMYEDGRRVHCPFVNAEDLTKARKKKKQEETKVPQRLAFWDLRHGVTYVTLTDKPSCSDFLKGDRIKLLAGSRPNEAEFEHEDGRRVIASYVNPMFLAIADEKEVPVTKTLREADVRHGQVYVVLKDKASCSDFKKGDRVKLRAGSKPIDHHFVHEDGREVSCPYVWPEYLAFADGGKVAAEVAMPKTATLEDLKPGAVFKVEGMTGYHGFPMGSIVQHTGEFSESARPRMQLLTLDGGGLKQYVHLQDVTVVTEGKGAAVAPKPVKGSGKVVKTATRSDAHTFELRDCGAQGYMLQASCRWFTMAEAAVHWEETRKGTDLGNETFDILYLFNKHIDRLNAAKKKG